MKRKKWSELEEQTLLSKYAHILETGALSKLKTREKKFKPIAEHVNSLHHNQDPIAFPFKWTWRDVSIKVQNMRHQYLGVKQKIRVSDREFNWEDGEIHWENFLKYKQVFGDIELPDCGKDDGNNNISEQTNCKTTPFGKTGISDILEDGDVMDLGYGMDVGEEMEDEDDVDEEWIDLGINEGGGKGQDEKLGQNGEEKLRKVLKSKKWRGVATDVLELKELIMKREAERKEREWGKEINMMENGIGRKEWEIQFQGQLKEREERMHTREHKLHELQITWMRREVQKRRRLEWELDEERRRRMKLEEKWEEEEMEWKDRMIEMQIEHEKQMMQVQAVSCQNQSQLLGAVARLVCQFFGSSTDGLGGSVGALPPQDLQNLQHTGGLEGGDQKADARLPSEFL